MRLTLVLLPCLGSVAFGQFEDPAPPKVHQLEAKASPMAKAFEGLTIHQAPRALAADATVEDWPSFLGPRRDGTSLESIKAWGEDGPPLLWEVLIGEGYSQPVIADGRVIVCHRQGGTSHVDCLDAQTGRRFWRHSFPCAYQPRYISDGGPRSTPTIDGEWVYVHAVEGRLMCLQLTTGRVRWERDLRAEFGLSDGFFGVVSSPLVHGDHLYLNIGAPGPTVACIDKASGRILWGLDDEWGASCASPVMASLGGRPYLLVLTGGESTPPTGGLLVLDPEDGRPAFRYPLRSRTVASVNGACPLAIGDDVFLTASYGVGAAGVHLNDEGVFSEAWRDRRSIDLQFSNPVALGGMVYAIDGTSGRMGELVCVDPATGDQLSRTPLSWEERVIYGGRELERDFSVGEASLLIVDGKLLCLGDQGHLLWLEVSPKGAQILARASLFRAQESWTPPALSRGLLFVRQTSPENMGLEPSGRRVLCFDLR